MLRPSQLTRAIRVTVAGVVAAFSVAFSYILVQLQAQTNTASSFFSSGQSVMYLSVEGLFLGAVLAGAYYALRRKK